ncbi:hypothetical protein AB8O55_03475 [Saccharopolyspora cebuensis]|uniref:Uncharacterized protein n=1 Tax=Saccharopolyspora cebuensis TaxID=418759 RepID=A0ABV4CCD7_9PSEU
MSNPLNDPRLSELVAQLDDALTAGEQVAEEAARTSTAAPGLTEEDIAELERHARGGGATPELAELQRRIDAGEFSWQDVLAGRVSDDPGVQRGLAAGMADVQEASTLLHEGHDVDDIIAAKGAEAGPVGRRPGPSEDDWDDDWEQEPDRW